MTQTEFLAWMDRMGFRTSEQAAHALGVSRFAVESWRRAKDPNPISRTVELLCECLERLEGVDRQP